MDDRTIWEDLKVPIVLIVFIVTILMTIFFLGRSCEDKYKSKGLELVDEKDGIKIYRIWDKGNYQYFKIEKGEK